MDGVVVDGGGIEDTVVDGIVFDGVVDDIIDGSYGSTLLSLLYSNIPTSQANCF